jgi:hypothetical protein
MDERSFKPAARSGRAARLVVLAALLWPGLARSAIVSVGGGGVFVAEDANQWGSGPATIVDVGYNTDPLFLGFSFDTGNFGFDGIAGSEPFAFGLAFDGRFAGKAGLEIGYYFDSGSVDARYPFEFGYQYMDTEGIESAILADPSWNRQISMGPSFEQSAQPGDTWLTTNFPEVGAYADAVLQLQAKAIVEGCIFGCLEVNLIPSFLRNVDERQELFAFNRPDASGEPDGQLRVMGLGGVGFDIDTGELSNPGTTTQSGKVGGGAGIVVTVDNIGFGQPMTVSGGFGYGPFAVTTELAEMTLSLPQALDMQGALDTSSPVTRLSAASSDSVVDLKLDMDAMVAAFVPFVPPGDVTVDLGIASLELLLIDYKLGPSLDLAQNVSLAPEPTLSLDFDQAINVFKNGEILRTDHVDVLLGVDDIAIQFPNRELNVTPTFSLNPKFSNDLDLNLSLNSRLEALGLGADFFDIGGFEIGPLFTREDQLANTKLADLVTTRFDLTGAIEDAVNLNLQPFTLGEGWRLAGESAALPRYAAVTLPDGSADYSFRFDQTDLAAGPQPMYVSYFGSQGDTYRAVNDEVHQECDFWFFGCLDWDTVSQEHTTKAIYAAHTDDPPDPFPLPFASGGRTYSIVNPAGSLVTLPDQTPLRVAATNTPALIPTALQDDVDSFSYNIFDDYRGWGTEHTYYSDLVDILDSTRYDGFGLTAPVYLAYPLLDTVREGDELVTRFAQSLEFDIADFVDNATGYEFESLTLPWWPYRQLLQGLGDTDGITLDVWDETGGDWANLTTWNPLFSDLNFNFFDDYLRGLTDPGLSLVGTQGNWAVDGVSRFRIGDLDVDTSLNIDTLLSAFGPGGTNPLVAGITVTDLVMQQGLTGGCVYFLCTENYLDLQTLHGPLPGTGPSGYPPVFGAYYAGTAETIFDPTLLASPGLNVTLTPSFAELARAPLVIPPGPQPEPGLGPSYQTSVPPQNVPPEATPSCTSAACESTPLTKTDPDTGETVVVTGTGFQELETKGYLNPGGEPQTGQHGPPPPQPGDPVPPPGSHPDLALDATGGSGSSRIFDFDQIDFGGAGVWGGDLDYAELVFRADNTLAGGSTPCAAALPNLADGQIIGRAVQGTSPGYLRFATGGLNAADVASCFEQVAPVSLAFGTEAPVFLDVPFAPIYDFSVDGALFNSVFLPWSGAGEVPLEGLIDILLYEASLDDFVKIGSMSLGDEFFFGPGVDFFRLSGLRIPDYFLDHNPSLWDANPSFAVGITLDHAGTVITASGSGFPSAGVPAPASLTLLGVGLLALGFTLRQRRTSPRGVAVPSAPAMSNAIPLPAVSDRGPR